MPASKEGPKSTGACTHCRSRKVKCSGDRPCTNCVNHDKECVYPPSQRGKRTRDGTLSSPLEDRIARVESLLNSTRGGGNAVVPTPALDGLSTDYAQLASSHAHYPPAGDSHSNLRRESIVLSGISGNTWRDAGGQTTESVAESRRTEDPRDLLPSPMSTIPYPGTQETGAGPRSRDRSKETSRERAVDKEESVLSPQKANWEHHGPGSWLSVCSMPGIRWVTEKTGSADFRDMARELTVGWTKRLTIGRTPRGPCTPEPDASTAWEYCQAYFEEAFDAVYGIVYRPDFEARLRLHFEHNALNDDEPAWYALRNTVYASGCRVYLSRRRSTSFAEAQAQAWRYLENALSVYVDLLFTPSGLMAVQALVAMTFYVEGIGSPALEYMMCANAVRLAQGKGLHRQPSKTWNLPENEVLNHQWLFWAIYCCDKQLAQRSGRPSAIDDDDVSCQIPTKVAPGSTIDIELFTQFIKHAKISSQISRRVMSVKAFHQKSDALIQSVNELSEQLQSWRDSLPPHLQLDTILKACHISPGSRNIHSVFLSHIYHGSVMALHTIFAYPWISAMFGNPLSSAIRTQETFSSNILADAARNIIRTTRGIIIDAATPQLSAFYYPMVGLINLFIFILKHPTLPSTQSDIALLDVATGHFGHMEDVTSSELAFPFTREAAALARQTVKKEKERLNRANLPTAGEDGFGMDSNPLFGTDAFDANDFDMESWNIFSSTFMDELPVNNETMYFSG